MQRLISSTKGHPCFVKRVSSLESKIGSSVGSRCVTSRPGSVISHITEHGTDRPNAYASRSLTKAERNNSVIEKEALAIIFGIRKLQLCLYGRKFTLLTDHQPLTLLFGSKRGTAPIAASRLQRWVIQLSAYQYEIRWRSHADAFSRLPSEINSENQDLEREAEVLTKLQVARVPLMPSFSVKKLHGIQFYQKYYISLFMGGLTNRKFLMI